MRLTKKRILIAVALVFVISFSWLAFLSDGLPIGDLDDWDYTLASQDTSWQTFITNFTLPWSQSKYWVGQYDRMDQVERKRLFHSMMLKFINQTFGPSPAPLYLVSKCLFFAGTIAVLFALLLLLTQSMAISLASLFFFVLVPAHYSHALWISDPVTMVHFFVVVGILTTYFLDQNLKNKGSSVQFWSLTALLFITGWIGIKTKVPALILPLTIGFYFLIDWLQQKQEKPNTSKICVIFILLGIIAFQTVPIKYLGVSDSPDSYQLSNLLRMLFRNYECGYENEPTTAFFSREWIWPVSITRTFGFYLLWSLLALTVYYLWSRIRNKAAHFFAHPIAKLSLIWLLLELFLMGLFPPEPRYFSGTFMPLTLLIAQLILLSFQTMIKPVRILIGLLFISVLVWTSIVNLSHVTWLRLNIGRRLFYLLNTTTTIYRDLFPGKEPTPKELGLFCSLKYKPAYYQGPRLERVLYHTDLGLGVWNRTPDGKPENFEKYAKEGFRYYVSESPDLFKSSTQVSLLTTVPGTHPTHLSWVEQMLYSIKRKKKPILYIYKFSNP